MIQELSVQICEELKRTVKTFDDDSMVEIAEKLDKANRIFCVGLGRSRLAVMCFAIRLMHLGYSVHLVGDVTTPAIQKGDVLVVGSGSGETGSLLGMTKKSLDVGAEICLITRKERSTLAERASAKLVINVQSSSDPVQGAFQSIQPMGSLFEQACLLAYDSIVLYLMRKNQMDATKMRSFHANLE